MPRKHSSPAGPASGATPVKTPCTCAKLRRTARRVTQAYDRALKPAGLRLTQYSVLANLVWRGPLSITDLAELLAMDRTTLTRNLRPLDKAGWLAIGEGPDRRSRAVAVTAAGRRVYKRALPLWKSAEHGLRRKMGPGEAAALRDMLDDAWTSAS